ncbi:MAG: hypothetical protein OXI01_16910 [Albidovulum sp.]|nr:hypothetical protein [Albidovulum sp.]
MPIFIVISYTAILILSVVISGYLSYEGLLRTAEEITLPLVVFLMTVILAMDATISYFRSSERSYRLPIVIWMVAAFFSIASNFNFLYSNFMRDDVTENTVTRQIEIFRSDLVETRDQLSELDAVRYSTALRTNLALEFDNLYNQIKDPLRPGCGEECRGHMGEIERILGQSITNLAIPPIGSIPDVVEDWYSRYRSAAEEILAVSLRATDEPAIKLLLKRIENALLEYDTAARVMSSKGGLEVLAGMSGLSLDIEREANALLPEGKTVSHRDIDPTLGRLGEIVYAFQNGFGEMPNPMATAISIVLASVIDLIPFLLSFALFGKGRLERQIKTGTSRGSGKRTIIS